MITSSGWATTKWRPSGSAWLPAVPGPPPAAALLPTPDVATTSLDCESTASGLSPPRVLATAPRRIPSLLWMETVAWVGWPVTPTGLCRGGSGGPAPVGWVSAVRPLAAAGWQAWGSWRGTLLRRVASLPLLATGRAAGGGHLLNQVERHLRVDVGLRVDRVGPAGPQRLLNPVLAATRTANKLNTIQYGGWKKLFSEGELQLSEIGKNLVQKVRITGICDMVFCSAARTKDVAGDGRHKEQLILAELWDELLQ